MELFVAGLVLGVLIVLCLRRDPTPRGGDEDNLDFGRRQGGARCVRPEIPAKLYPPRRTSRAIELRIGTGAKGTQPIGYVNPLPPRPTPPPPRRD